MLRRRFRRRADADRDHLVDDEVVHLVARRPLDEERPEAPDDARPPELAEGEAAAALARREEAQELVDRPVPELSRVLVRRVGLGGDRAEGGSEGRTGSLGEQPWPTSSSKRASNV